MGRTSGKWTLDEVPDLEGRTYVVTGANAGLGLETARVCAQRGARVILACRNPQKAEAAAAELRAESPRGSVETVQLDLASLASVRACAQELRERAPCLTGLVNNAGIMMTPYARTEDGFESQLGTNHFGHFALTGLLLPSLLAVPGARVVSVSSLYHSRGEMDWDNLNYDGGHGYDRSEAYGRSKLANLLFMRGLSARFEQHGIDARSLAAHPGFSDTNLMDPLADQVWIVRASRRAIVSRVQQSAAMGALPTLRALVDPDANSGEYYGPDGFRQLWGYPKTVGSTRASRDPQDIERLWRVSEQLTGVTYPWPSSAVQGAVVAPSSGDGAAG